MLKVTSSVSAANASQSLFAQSLDQAAAPPRRGGTEDEVKARFQDFVAGTFYKEMVKALRSAQRPPRYLYGGQAEQIFQGQLDQVLTDELARSHGGRIAGGLYELYARQHGRAPAESHSTGPAHALDIAV
jgi:Rod binding domain-containing protein